MSSIYYVGTYKENKNGFYEINYPMVLTGITASFVRDLMKFSNIEAYTAFTLCSTEDIHRPLFYTIDKEWLGSLSEKYEECFEKGINMEQVPRSNYPLVCDGIERNGFACHIKADSVKQPDYATFMNLDLSKDTIGNFLSENQYFSNNHDDLVLETLIASYNTLSAWIASNEKIYWYQY